MNLVRKALVAGLVAGLCLVGTQPVSAQSTWTYLGANGTLSASATFHLVGTTLEVTLSNDSLFDCTVPSDVLTGLFFNTVSALTPVRADLNGSTVYYGQVKKNVGEGWSYSKFSPPHDPAHGMNSGISAAGLGVFGQANFFSPPVTPLDGLNYGILSAGDDVATYNGGIEVHGPLFKHSLKFVLTVPTGFNLSQVGNTVVFQYGTALTEPYFDGHTDEDHKVGDGTGDPAPTVPEASSLILLAFGGLPLLAIRRRRA